SDLRQVHVAAAAEAENDVRPEVLSHPDACLRDSNGGFRLATIKHFDMDIARLDRLPHSIDHARLDQHGIAHDQQPFPSQSAGNLAELLAGVAAEQELAGGVKGPGLAQFWRVRHDGSGPCGEGKGLSYARSRAARTRAAHDQVPLNMINYMPGD